MDCPTTNSSAALPVLSLVVALLAVFVGPILTWKLTGRQIKEARDATDKQLEAAKRSANKQIVAPLREAWIRTLRTKIAQLCSRMSALIVHTEGISIKEIFDLYEIRTEIILMLNLEESDHQRLNLLLDKFLSLKMPKTPKTEDTRTTEEEKKVLAKMYAVRNEIEEVSRAIFKREWTRVKTEDAN
ncbi:MAG: hypothetical protein P4L10_11495 [Acidobacteriaceae bacterium]|nr:hypothetical protein [Acidobacteriaceae bacterium]